MWTPGILQRPKKRRPHATAIDSQRHRTFVKNHACSVKGCRNTDIEPHHTKTRGSGGGDEMCVSLCRKHHREVDTGGGRWSFQRRYGIDFFELAKWFASRSPDKRIREAVPLMKKLEEKQAARLMQVSP